MIYLEDYQYKDLFLEPFQEFLCILKLRYRVLMVIPLAFPIASLLRQVPMKRRLLTDILTQDGEDGSYIRSALRKWKPGLWSNISR